MNIFGSIRSRVLFGTLGLALVPLILASLIIGYMSYSSGRSTTEDRVRSQLDSVRATQSTQLQAYFDSLAATMRVLVNNPSVQSSFLELDAAIDLLPSQTNASEADQRAAVLAFFEGPFQEQYKIKNAGRVADVANIVNAYSAIAVAVQYHYIAQNPNALGQKNLLSDAGDGSAFSAAHRKLHPFASSVKDQFGFYDVFLADLDGNLVYTYFKEADVGTSLTNGPFARTNFGDAFRMALESDDPNKVHFADFKPYLPSYEDQAAFLSIPIYQGESKIGVLLTQAPVDRIDAVATLDKRWTESGLGKSGQSLLIGADKVQRTISRQLLESPKEYAASLASKFSKAVADETLLRESDIGQVKVDTEATTAALAGKSGSAQYVNHLGDRVLGSYQPIKILDTPFALVSEITSEEAFKPINDLLRRIGLAALLTAGGLGLIGLVVSRTLASSINKPIEVLQNTVREISEGKMDSRTHMKGGDELGQLGTAFDNLLDERVSTLVASAHENEVLNNSVIDIMQSLGSLAQNDLTVKIPVTGDVTGAISDAINLVTTETSSALRQVLNISTNVARASSLVRQRSNDVATSAEQNVQEISEVSSELEGTARALKDISGQAQSANRAAEQAITATTSALKIVSETVQGVTQSRDQIRETEKRLKRLGERTQEINSVVGIINQIAERTSVLALNAGMQAAAAGEAGRGFALVADEVKRLAESARDATRQIGTLVNGIQADTVDTMRTMNETISQVVDISKLAERAGEQMEQTLSVTDGLVNSVREITATTTAQAATSDSLLRRAKAIDSANKETLTQLTAQREETSRLMQYSKALVDTVKVFKLPGVDSQNGSGG